MNTKIIIKIIFKMNSKKKTIYIFLIALCLWPTTKGPYHLVQWGAKKLFLVGHVQQNLRSFVSKSFETFFARYVFWLSCYAPSQHLNYRIELDMALDLFLENQNLCSSSWSFGEVSHRFGRRVFQRFEPNCSFLLKSAINILNLGKEWLLVH